MASRDTSSTPRALALGLLGFIALMFWLSGCGSSPRQFSTFGAIERPWERAHFEVHMEDCVLCARDGAEETGLGPARGPSARILVTGVI